MHNNYNGHERPLTFVSRMTPEAHQTFVDVRCPGCGKLLGQVAFSEGSNAFRGKCSKCGTRVVVQADKQPEGRPYQERLELARK